MGGQWTFPRFDEPDDLLDLAPNWRTTGGSGCGIRCGFVEVSLVVDGGLVAVGAVEAPRVVKVLDVRGDSFSCSVECHPGLLQRELLLERPEEGLRDGSVPAVSLAAHAWHRIVLFERRLVGVARVLAATIGVVDEACRRGPCREGTSKGAETQLGVDDVVECPADDFRPVVAR